MNETFERFVIDNYKHVFNYIHMLVKDYEISKDVTQDTFLRACAGFKRLRKKEKFTVWVMKIARNLAFNRLKKERRRQRTFISLFTKRYNGELVDVIPDPAVPLEQRAGINEEKNVVRRVLYDLPSRMREILILKEWESLSYQQIGAVMKISRKAVKSLLHRAREAARKRLEKEDIFKK